MSRMVCRVRYILNNEALAKCCLDANRGHCQIFSWYHHIAQVSKSIEIIVKFSMVKLERKILVRLSVRSLYFWLYKQHYTKMVCFGGYYHPVIFFAQFTNTLLRTTLSWSYENIDHFNYIYKFYTILCKEKKRGLKIKDGFEALKYLSGVYIIHHHFIRDF